MRTDYIGKCLFYLAGIWMWLLPPTAFGQQAVIVGRVFDAETGAPLPGVNVFLDQTLLGTSTKDDGSFRIHRLAPGSYNVVGSMVGFATMTKHVEVVPEISNYAIDLHLRPVVVGMDEIEVTATRPRGWKRDLRLFQELFLGNSPNGRQTRILNPYVLDFEKADGVFLASASEPLEIENLALGYSITFLLTEFRFDQNTELLRYQGPFYFKELTSTKESDVARWKQNREQTFRGSLQHLLRSMVRGNLEAQGFSVALDDRPEAPFSTEKPSLKSIEGLGIISEADRYYAFHLRFPHFLHVTFPGERSWISMNHLIATVHDTGYVYASLGGSGALTVYGSLSERRVADLLPRDFGLDEGSPQ